MQNKKKTQFVVSSIKSHLYNMSSLYNGIEGKDTSNQDFKMVTQNREDPLLHKDGYPEREDPLLHKDGYLE